MKTVVITGSARGLGFEMAKVFRKNDFHVVISDITKESLELAETKLKEIEGKGEVFSMVCDVTKSNDIENMIQRVIEKFEKIHIWINNAGINQPDEPIWCLEDTSIEKILTVDLWGTILCSKYIMKEMIKQKEGAIYNVEGYGSNDAVMKGLSIYGTAKRGITYFTEALAKECEVEHTGVIVGKLSPGIMITDFITNALGNEKIILPEKTKKVYNILGDTPDVVASFLVKEMIRNQKNGKKIDWLPNRKAAFRFMTAAFNKRDFFKENI